mmetsp:Transcript_8806/g.14395  ORF Transcript_8806/g.14395 Transcript_8806/m.14395 type:complete len:90 (-) Transcript_8806:1107-1376(-)
MQVEIVEEFLVSILLEKESAEFAVAGLLLLLEDGFSLEANKFCLEAKLEKELSETKWLASAMMVKLVSKLAEALLGLWAAVLALPCNNF